MALLLVVDNEVEVLATVADLLRHLGHEVATAPGGREAIAILEQGMEFDAVITDFDMPQRNGIEVLRTTMIHLPTAKRVLMTGGALSEGVKGIIRAIGVDEVLRKPISFEALFTLLTRLFPQLS